MYDVILDNDMNSFDTLDEAMSFAKSLNKFVTISGNGMEIVGKFGADAVRDNMCPDGIEYEWKKHFGVGKHQKYKD